MPPLTSFYLSIYLYLHLSLSHSLGLSVPLKKKHHTHSETNNTAPEVCIADEHGALLVDKFYEVDSTIQLVCIVRHIAMTNNVVFWLHNDRTLNFDMTRGGIR